MKVVAYAPCHITGFFQICFSDDYAKTGSEGAGISISLGSIAEIKESKKFILEGNIGKGEVTKHAIQSLTNETFQIKIKNQLPLSQGFGVSASSSLAACLGIAHLLDMPYKKALEAVHKAEIKNKTGLGDAIASFIGGLEIREKAGLQGKIRKIDCEAKLILAIIGKKLETKKILKNEKIIAKINEVGEECLKEFITKPSLEKFFDLSLRFSYETGLANEKMQKILNKANKIGKASMTMLGNSIFALYSKEMKEFLSSYKIYECFIDNYGARILATFFP
ncbi:MAG: hypothetical protein DRN11_04630 [Thermoplasmata archaeon]|nr:MAG: hypothetical protein DRN11_04630 [Thermoplasmata archaeon]